MDGSRFDALTRSLFTALSRRGLSRAGAGFLLVGTASWRTGLPASGNGKKKGGKKGGKKGKKKPGPCGSGCGGGTLCCPSGCVDVINDRANCGRCGNVCASNQVCRNLECALCEPPKVPCGNQCIDITSDPTNCGSCGTPCRKYEECQQLKCVCRGERCQNGACCPIDYRCVGEGTGCCLTGYRSCGNGICCRNTMTCGGSCGNNCCNP